MKAHSANLLFILSDEHAAHVTGYSGDPVRTPNLDLLAASGTVFDNAYTTCPICVPARASLATGRYVHEIRNWDNSMGYDGALESWHHVLRRNGVRVESVGKLHFSSTGDDHGFSAEHIPLHIFEGKGDLLATIRRNPPVRNKRSGILEAGPGTSSYIRYDRQIADLAASRIRELSRAESPWALFVGFVQPHPPYISPPERYRGSAAESLPMPPQWSQPQWPHNRTLDLMRSVMSFDTPFDEAVIRRVNAAYRGACEELDADIGIVLDAVETAGSAARTTVVYSSDHGEQLGARGIFGKFTMYDESARIPLICRGPSFPSGRRVSSAVSLIDFFPTNLRACSVQHDGEALPGIALQDVVQRDEPGRCVFSEYHTLGTRRAVFMVTDGRWKLVRYLDGGDSLFHLETDPLELVDRVDDANTRGVRDTLASRLQRIVNPRSADRRARADQRRQLRRNGGRSAVIARGTFDNSPIPGENAKFM